MPFNTIKSWWNGRSSNQPDNSVPAGNNTSQISGTSSSADHLSRNVQVVSPALDTQVALVSQPQPSEQQTSNQSQSLQERAINWLKTPLKYLPSAEKVVAKSFDYLAPAETKRLLGSVAEKIVGQILEEFTNLRKLTEVTVNDPKNQNGDDYELNLLRKKTRDVFNDILIESLQKPVRYIVDRLNSRHDLTEDQRQIVVDTAIAIAYQELTPVILDAAESGLKNVENKETLKEVIESSLAEFLGIAWQKKEGSSVDPLEYAASELIQKKTAGISDTVSEKISDLGQLLYHSLPLYLDKPVFSTAIMDILEKTVKDAVTGITNDQNTGIQAGIDSAKFIPVDKLVIDSLVSLFRQELQASVLKKYQNRHALFSFELAGGRMEAAVRNYIDLLLENVRSDYRSEERDSRSQRGVSGLVDYFSSFSLIKQKLASAIISLPEKEEWVQENVSKGLDALVAVAKRAITTGAQEIQNAHLRREAEAPSNEAHSNEMPATSALPTVREQLADFQASSSSASSDTANSASATNSPAILPEEVPQLSKALQELVGLLFTGVEQNQQKILSGIDQPADAVIQELVDNTLETVFLEHTNVERDEAGGFVDKNQQILVATKGALGAESRTRISALLSKWLLSSVKSIKGWIDDHEDGARQAISKKLLEPPNQGISDLSEPLVEFIEEATGKAVLSAMASAGSEMSSVTGRKKVPTVPEELRRVKACSKSTSDDIDLHKRSAPELKHGDKGETLDSSISRLVPKRSEQHSSMGAIRISDKNGAQLHQDSFKDELIDGLALNQFEQMTGKLSDQSELIVEEVLHPVLETLVEEMSHAHKGVLGLIRQWFSHEQNLSDFSKKLSDALTPVLTRTICENEILPAAVRAEGQQKTAVELYVRGLLTEKMPLLTGYLTKSLLDRLTAHENELGLYVDKEIISPTIEKAQPKVIEIAKRKLDAISDNIERHRNHQHGLSRLSAALTVSADIHKHQKPSQIKKENFKRDAERFSRQPGKHEHSNALTAEMKSTVADGITSAAFPVFQSMHKNKKQVEQTVASNVETVIDESIKTGIQYVDQTGKLSKSNQLSKEAKQFSGVMAPIWKKVLLHKVHEAIESGFQWLDKGFKTGELKEKIRSALTGEAGKDDNERILSPDDSQKGLGVSTVPADYLKPAAYAKLKEITTDSAKDAADRLSSALQASDLLSNKTITNGIDQIIQGMVSPSLSKAEDQLDRIKKEKVINPLADVIKAELWSVYQKGANSFTQWAQQENNARQLISNLRQAFRPLAKAQISSMLTEYIDGYNPGDAEWSKVDDYLEGVLDSGMDSLLQMGLNSAIQWMGDFPRDQDETDVEEKKAYNTERLIKGELGKLVDHSKQPLLEAVEQRLEILKATAADCEQNGQGFNRFAGRLQSQTAKSEDKLQIKNATAEIAENSQQAEQAVQETAATEATATHDESYQYRQAELVALGKSAAASVNDVLDAFKASRATIQNVLESSLKVVTSEAMTTVAQWVDSQVESKNGKDVKCIEKSFERHLSPLLVHQFAGSLLDQTAGFVEEQLSPEGLVRKTIEGLGDKKDAIEEDQQPPLTLEAYLQKQLKPVLNENVDIGLAGFAADKANELSKLKLDNQFLSHPLVANAIETVILDVLSKECEKGTRLLNRIAPDIDDKWFKDFQVPVRKAVVQELMVLHKKALKESVKWLNQQENRARLVARMEPALRPMVTDFIAHKLLSDATGQTPRAVDIARISPFISDNVHKVFGEAVDIQLNSLVQWADDVDSRSSEAQEYIERLVVASEHELLTVTRDRLKTLQSSAELQKRHVHKQEELRQLQSVADLHKKNYLEAKQKPRPICSVAGDRHDVEASKRLQELKQLADLSEQLYLNGKREFKAFQKDSGIAPQEKAGVQGLADRLVADARKNHSEAFAKAESEKAKQASEKAPAAQNVNNEIFSKYKNELIQQFANGVTKLTRKVARLIAKNKPAVVPAVKRHAQTIANRLVNVAVFKGVEKTAGPEDANRKKVTEAIRLHVENNVSQHLDTLINENTDSLVAYLSSKEALSEIRGAIVNGLTPDENEDGKKDKGFNVKKSGRKLSAAIDNAIKKSFASVDSKVGELAGDSPSLPIPLLQQFAKNAMAHVCAKGGSWIGKHQDEIWEEVVPGIKEQMKNTLRQAQTEALDIALDWQKNDENVKQLINPLVSSLEKTVTKLVTSAAAAEIAEKIGGDVESVRLGIKLMIKPLVKPLMKEVSHQVVQSLSDWSKQNREAMVAELSSHADQMIDAAAPVIHEEIRKVALSNAARKVDQMDVSKLAEKVAQAIPETFDFEKMTEGVVSIGKKTCIPKELPKVLCFLIQKVELYKALGGKVEEGMYVDRLIIDGDCFKDIKAKLKVMADGSIRVDKLSFEMPNQPTPDDSLEISASDVSLDYQLPENSKLRKAAILAAAGSLTTENLASTLFKEFFPNKVHMTAGKIKGGFKDYWAYDQSTAAINFDISDIEADFNVQKHYPTGYMDMNIHAPREVNLDVSSDGIVKLIQGTLKLDNERNGHADICFIFDPTRQSKLIHWLVGDVRVEAGFTVKNGVGYLDNTGALKIDCDRPFFQPLCHAMIKNTIKACIPGVFKLREGHVLKLKAKLFNEKRGNKVLNFFAKAANFFFSFFIPTIKIKIPFTGFSRLEPGEEGLLGKFNFLTFVDSIFPWPVSIHKQSNEGALQGISKTDDKQDVSEAERLKRIESWKQTVFMDMRHGHVPSANRSLRLVSEQVIYTMLQNARIEGISSQRVSALKILALLATAEPEKAVSVLQKIGRDTGDFNGIIDFIKARIAEPEKDEPYKQAMILPLSEEQEKLERLLQYYENSQNSPDGCIYKGIEQVAIKKKFVSQVGNIAAKQLQEHGGLINEVLPPDLIALMDPAFEFKDKFLSSVAVPVRQLSADDGYASGEGSIASDVSDVGNLSDLGGDSDDDSEGGYSSESGVSDEEGDLKAMPVNHGVTPEPEVADHTAPK